MLLERANLPKRKLYTLFIEPITKKITIKVNESTVTFHQNQIVDYPSPPFKIISSENIFLQESEPQSKEKQREKKKLDIEVDFREVGKDFFITLPN